jgi:serine/threonine-protein kinase
VVRVSRDGGVAPYDSSWYGRFNSLALSPDGRQLAVGSGSSTGGLNIWIKRLDRGPFTRLSFGGQDRRPVWSPDGRLVAFVRDTGGTGIVVARPADGSGPDRRLVRIDRQIQEVDWSRDGRWILVRTDNSTSGAGDIVGIRTEGDSTPVPLVASGFTELNPALSPDGRWLAYSSDESGTSEVYVRPFPNTGDGRWQVSNGGGTGPRWSFDGRELYFLDPGSRLIAAQVARGATFVTPSSRSLFDASGLLLDTFHQSYDVTRDGRFIFLSPRRPGGDSRAPRIVRVDNWFRDVRARLAQ